MTFNTGKPVPSTDPRDLYDNAQNLDKFANGEELEYPDRLGVPRKSLAGIRAEVTDALSRLGYQVIGDYAAGLIVQNYGQVFRKDGEFYRAKAETTLPYPLNGDWAVDAPKFVSVGDAVLRQELESPGGAALVGSNTVTVSSISALSEVPTDKGLSVQLISGGRSGLFYWQQGNLSAKVSEDSLQGIYVAPASDETGASGAWVRQFGQSAFNQPEVWAEWWGAVGDYADHNNPGTNSGPAIRAALLTGHNVALGLGRFSISDRELLMVAPGQRIRGQGCGTSYFGAMPATKHQPATDLVFVGAGEKYIMTRRLYRASAADPQDPPLSVGINVSAPGVEIADLSVVLSCDYTDTSHTNLGSDWDVGILVRTQPQVSLINVRVLGYWRNAGIRFDGTQAANLPGFTTPQGVVLPNQPNESTQYSGFDQATLKNVFTQGGLKGLWLAGPILHPSGDNYYDGGIGAAVADGRGSAGCADFHAENCTFFSREHISLRRAADPAASPLAIENEDIDVMPCALAIDVRGVSAGGVHGRRLLFTNTRIRSFEIGHIVVRRGTEIYFNLLHTEPSPGSTVFDTLGNVIDQTEYLDPNTGTYYGPIAIYDDPTFATRTIHIAGINVRDPAPSHFQNKTLRYSITQTGNSSVESQNRTLFYRGIDLPNQANIRALGGSSIRHEFAGLCLFSRLGVDLVEIGDGYYAPSPDNSIRLGGASARWTELFAASGTINTSDEREKQQLTDISTNEINAANEIKGVMKKFKWNDAVERKGDSARWHFGVMAQDIQRVFEKHGLDAHEYGMFCYDEWGEQPEILDKDGNVSQEYRPAGNRYGVRYDQLLAFIVAAI